MPTTDSIDIRPARGPYIVFGTVFMPFFLIYLFGYFNTGDYGALIICLLSLVGLCVSWIWIWSHKLTVGKDIIIFGRFPPFRKSLKFSEISGWYNWIGFRDNRGRIGPFVRLVIEPTKNSGKRAIILPSKLFTLKDFRMLQHILSRETQDRKVDR